MKQYVKAMPENTINKPDDILRFLASAPKEQVFTAFSINLQRKVKALVENEGTVFVYAPRCSRRGWRYVPKTFSSYYNIIITPPKDENAAWQRRLKRAVKCMEASGLWGNIKDMYSKILASGMTWEDRCKMSDLYWQYCCPSGKHTDEEIRLAYAEYIKKFPFCFHEANDGTLQVETNYIWQLSACKLKSMYFGKYENTQYKNEILAAIKEKRSFNIPRVIVGYDISFEYSADKNMAWYSEEFRNCGNGHYYLALDHSTALFAEDD